MFPQEKITILFSHDSEGGCIYRLIQINDLLNKIALRKALVSSRGNLSFQMRLINTFSSKQTRLFDNDSRTDFLLFAFLTGTSWFPDRLVSLYVSQFSLPNLATVIPVINRSYVNRTVRRFLGRKKSHGRRSASQRQLETSPFPVTCFSTERAKYASFGDN
jgi:hypothetical protein